MSQNWRNCAVGFQIYGFQRLCSYSLTLDRRFGGKKSKMYGYTSLIIPPHVAVGMKSAFKARCSKDVFYAPRWLAAPGSDLSWLSQLKYLSDCTHWHPSLTHTNWESCTAPTTHNSLLPFHSQDISFFCFKIEILSLNRAVWKSMHKDACVLTQKQPFPQQTPGLKVIR